MSVSFHLDGIQRWVVETGDSLDVLRTMPDACVDAVVTDPPAGIAFMGKGWDEFGCVHDRKVGRGGTSEDRAKASLRAKREFIPWLAAILTEAYRVTKPGGRMLCWSIPRTMHWTGCAIEDAGWTIENTVAHMFGCLSDDTEILTSDGWSTRESIAIGTRIVAFDATRDVLSFESVEETYEYRLNGPAFAIRSNRTDQIVSPNHRCVVRAVDGQWAFISAEEAWQAGRATVPVVEDVRDMLDALSMSHAFPGTGEEDVLTAMRWLGHKQESPNNHPTVKSTALMRYLVRLVTKPDDIVLDPFCGSGSTGKGALMEGRRFIGIEREVEYADIARARIANADKSSHSQTPSAGQLGLLGDK